MSQNSHPSRATLKGTIEKRGFVKASDARIITRESIEKNDGWLFDIKNILLDPTTMHHIGELFWEAHADLDEIQIAGVETAGIPLIATLVLIGHEKYKKKASGFFLRKSRKKDGLMKMMEGEMHKNRPVILVDDLINSGKSLMRQVEALEENDMKVIGVWTLVRFRNPEYYEYFNAKSIPIRSPFELNDFQSTLGITNLVKKNEPNLKQGFVPKWKFSGGDPSFHFVVPKSDPAIDDKRVFFGSDHGVFWCLDQKSGQTLWSYKVGFHPKGKGIFSSPALFENTVFFGAYDGNVYALDFATGKRKWIFMDADWVGSSPCVAEDLGLVFIGLEFGLFKKRGGIAAIDIESGKLRWHHYDMPTYTHSSPLYIKEHGQVVIGSNDGTAYLFNAADGSLVWKFATGTPNEEELKSGFSSLDIKESFVYDKKRDVIIFGNKHGSIFFVSRKEGKEIGRFTAEFGFYSTPAVYKDTVLAASLDKHLYCIDLNTHAEKWKWYAGARIFATPFALDGHVYIGANTGRLAELNAETGEETAFFQATERITNKIAYNPETQRFFVTTFANELYCLEKMHETA
ncbi:hypothetical protein A2635_01430 [Candidatus Peribacteria bacterium RIFCSPHIGHO2_01_FULL_51_9]|nr:MAG: hypothetical protein A2635_01430 [Candidatus Peribacteria bacterium RIFCSPHIGHO2_01_FULL_51_9]